MATARVRPQRTGSQLEQEPLEVEENFEALVRQRRWLIEVDSIEWSDGTVTACRQLDGSHYRNYLYNTLRIARRRMIQKRLAARLKSVYGNGLA